MPPKKILCYTLTVIGNRPLRDSANYLHLCPEQPKQLTTTKTGMLKTENIVSTKF